MADIFSSCIALPKQTLFVGILFMAVVTAFSVINYPQGFYVFPGAILPWAGLALAAIILGLYAWVDSRRKPEPEAGISA
jgi:hypothetical protein